MAKPLVVTSLSVTKEELRYIADQAKYHGVSRSAFLRLLVEAHKAGKFQVLEE